MARPFLSLLLWSAAFGLVAPPVTAAPTGDAARALSAAPLWAPPSPPANSAVAIADLAPAGAASALLAAAEMKDKTVLLAPGNAYLVAAWEKTQGAPVTWTHG